MMIRLRQLLRRGHGEEGAAAVEFALILPILVFLVLGGMDLGHRFYMQNLITNASREGARFAAKYTGTNADPNATAVSDYVKLPPPAPGGLNYNAFNFDTLTVTTTLAGTVPNRIVTVTVTALKHWWVLGAFTFFNFPGFTNPQTLTATTAMNLERSIP
jgi:Flp pilus assembly protein TadG